MFCFVFFKKRKSNPIFMFHTNYFIYSESRNDEVFETSTVISQMDQKAYGYKTSILEKKSIT